MGLKRACYKLKELFLTWHTGYTTDQRNYMAWVDANIVPYAYNATDFFKGFKYVIALDYQKVCTRFDPPHGYLESRDFLSYLYPERPLDSSCMFRVFRGEWNKSNGRFYFNDFGVDQAFIATNSEEDAVMLTLKFT